MPIYGTRPPLLDMDLYMNQLLLITFLFSGQIKILVLTLVVVRTHHIPS